MKYEDKAIESVAEKVQAISDKRMPDRVLRYPVPSSKKRVDYTKGRDETEFPEVVSDRAGSYNSGMKTIVEPQDAAAFSTFKLIRNPHYYTLIKKI